jgi:hypothetical protein
MVTLPAPAFANSRRAGTAISITGRCVLKFVPLVIPSESVPPSTVVVTRATSAGSPSTTTRWAALPAVTWTVKAPLL